MGQADIEKTDESADGKLAEGEGSTEQGQSDPPAES